MTQTMTGDEVKLCLRIIGLRMGRMTATGNYWERRRHQDRPTILSLQEKGHAEPLGDGWRLTSQGIQQLKQQIGEFKLPRPR